ncbi:MAG: hypothetical protein KAS65_10575 [Candidatus Aminicenantes bacterium]|nr:hypothetical protein [Candidatus Aminicenantes bacterium]
MRKIIGLLMVFMIMGSGLIQAKKVATFTDILKPGRMVIEDDQIYITEDTTVYIYSSQDYRFIKKFGKAGEGPREFLRFVIVIPHQDHLIINSFGKISLYTREGEFIKEIKASGGINFNYQPLGKNYVGVSISLEDNTRYESINLYDSQLKKIKTILKRESDTQPTKNVIKILNSTLQFLTFENKLYIVEGKEFVIKVYDMDVKELMVIKRDYDRVKFGEADKQKIFKELESNPRTKQYLDVLKKMAVFPDTYPAIVSIFQRDDFIYAMTFRRQDDTYEFFIFDGNGNFLKKIFIPFVFQTAMTPYPFSIKDGKLYQLIENEETEEWELYQSEIK